jgi:hypothetical protein
MILKYIIRQGRFYILFDTDTLKLDSNVRLKRHVMTTRAKFHITKN